MPFTQYDWYPDRKGRDTEAETHRGKHVTVEAEIRVM